MWFKDGLNIGNGSQYAIQNVSRMFQARYSCQVSNGQENKLANTTVTEVFCEYLFFIISS